VNNIFRRYFFLIYALGFTLVLFKTASAISFEQQLVGFSRNIIEKLKGVGVDKIVLEVKGDPSMEGSSPSSIREILGEELRKSGIKISRTSGKMRVTCRVEITPTREEALMNLPPALTVQVKADFNELDNPNVGAVDSEPLLLMGSDEISRFLGLPFDQGTPGASQNPAVNAYAMPKQSATQEIARTNESSPFGIGIWRDDRSADLTIEEGFAFVELNRNDEFGVKLVNDSSDEMGVYLTLDGIDSHWYQKKKAAWIVPPKSSIVIPGWQLDGLQSKPFKIVPFELSVAAREGADVSMGSSLGVIAASFYKCYKTREEIPASDLITGSLGPNGIGESDRSVDFKVVSVERYFGKLRAMVPVRYERP